MVDAFATLSVVDLLVDDDLTVTGTSAAGNYTGDGSTLSKVTTKTSVQDLQL